ncbi:hypothetical protein PLCT2_00057 [Planctomycetaceae bacterium]|nr:hypothetical protein PLCT2_00057 [Planctomycetaceae bacterium]
MTGRLAHITISTMISLLVGLLVSACDSPHAASKATKSQKEFLRIQFVDGLIPTQLIADQSSVRPMHGEQLVAVSSDRQVRAIVETTGKGNGLLLISDARTGEELFRRRIYDTHAEDDIWTEYVGGWLYYRFADFDLDGYLDLEISGAELVRSDAALLDVRPIHERYSVAQGAEFVKVDSK